MLATTEVCPSLLIHVKKTEYVTFSYRAFCIKTSSLNLTLCNGTSKEMWILILNLFLTFGLQVYGLEKKCSVSGGCSDGTTIKEVEVFSDNRYDCSLPGLCQVHKYVCFNFSLIPVHNYLQGDLDHEELNVLSEYQCVNMCKSFDNCAWYTFDSKTNVCFIFKTCPSLSEDCLDCVSGEKGCSLSSPSMHS